MLLISLIVGIGSQIHLNYKIPGFIVTLAVILLVILIYIFDVNYYKTIFITAMVSPAFRGIILFLSGESIDKTVSYVAPDVIFYMSFGLIFYIFNTFVRRGFSQFLIIAFVADIFSNIVEIGFRLESGSFIDHEIINYLFIIALIRTFITGISLMLFRYYKSFLKKEAHEKRYQRLLLLQSYFNSEIYFMEKNIDDIEQIMADAYKLHKISEDQKMSELSLKITKNIHEIKKDYIRVIDGLYEIPGQVKEKKGYLDINEILEILFINTKEYIENTQKNVDLRKRSLISSLKVKNHYDLISILRNLLNNAIESFESSGIVTVEAKKDEEHVIISVEDNGKGIKSTNQSFIFNLGYSTKFKSGDGKSHRGMGLAIVKSLIVNKYNGSIALTSKINEGTSFELKFPIENLRGENI